MAVIGVSPTRAAQNFANREHSMTPDQFRTALATRRAELEAERETLRIQREDIEARETTLILRSNELSWALEQFDLAPTAQPSPAKETKPALEKAPRDIAAAMILAQHFGHIPDSIDDLNASIQEQFNPRTL